MIKDLADEKKNKFKGLEAIKNNKNLTAIQR